MLSPGFSFLLLLVLLGIKLSKFLVYATYFFISYFFTLFTFKIIFMHYILIRVSPPQLSPLLHPWTAYPPDPLCQAVFKYFLFFTVWMLFLWCNPMCLFCTAQPFLTFWSSFLFPSRPSLSLGWLCLQAITSFMLTGCSPG